MYKLRIISFYNLYIVIIFFALSFSSSSCVSPKKINYFNDLKDDTMGAKPIVMNHVTTFVDPKIESNDVLSITVQTTAQGEGNAPMSSNASASRDVSNGFLVDKDGNVEIALIGKVKVAGLTTAEARDLLRQKAQLYYKEPVVIVRIINFDIMVLGDVGRPGVVTLSNEKAGIIDVIGLAGDLQLTAKRKNILLIRSEGDEKKFIRLDVTSSNIFRSPYYYVKQHDVIIVEPSDYKIQNSDNSFLRYFGIGTSLISIVSLLFAFKVIK